MVANDVRISLNIPKSEKHILQDLADERSTTITHVLRDAITFTSMLDAWNRDGYRFIIEREDGTRQEVIRR